MNVRLGTILGPTRSVRVALLREGPMTFDHSGLFSMNDLKSSERLAMNELEETLAPPSLDVGDCRTASRSKV